MTLPPAPDAAFAPASYSTNEANALIHLYRAEVGKMTAYRQRLDMTTNWSVVTTAGLSSFALGERHNSHLVFLFAMLMNCFFLYLEARRFRTFELSHQRTRLMERYFYPAILGGAVDPGWQQILLSELATPRSPISRWEAVGWRLRRNYLWIYLGVLIGWVAKLDILREQQSALSLEALIAAAYVGSLPGSVVWGIVAAFYTALGLLALRASRAYPLEEG